MPTRRGAQKYCSNTCRSKAYFHRKRKLGVPKPQPPTVTTQENKVTVSKVPTPKIAVEKVSANGVINAAIGSWIADGAQNFFKKEENKPATKGDINELKLIINGARYFPVNNMNNDSLGRRAFYDIETGNVIFLSPEYY